jgi:hypothetical protein
MKNSELIAELQRRDPDGDAQIYITDGDSGSYYDISKVNGFTNGPDTVLEAGEVRCTN